MSGALPGPAAAAPARARRSWIPEIPPRYLSSGLLTFILVFGQAFFDIIGGYERLALALGTALLTEVVLSAWLRGSWPVLLSAYISGNSVAILTKPAADLLWPFWIGSLLAISSKYVLTYRGRHLWNPTNFSVSALLLLAPNSMSLLSHQWSNALWAVAIVFAVGLLVVWRARLLHISVTYCVAFAALAWVRSLINGDPLRAELAPLTGPMYMLLIFFMLTDPRTTVGTTRGRILVTVLVALVECLIRLLPVTSWRGADALLTAPPIFALAIVGPIAMWFDLRRRPPTGPRGQRPAAPAPAATR